MKPKILVLAMQKAENYLRAVEAVGGDFEINYSPADFDGYDGLLLCGGNDIHPSFYGQEIDGSVNIDTERDEREIAVLKGFLNTGKPIFGICRGCQLLNVVLGGTLIQDIPCKEIHGAATFDLSHSVSCVKGSHLKRC